MRAVFVVTAVVVTAVAVGVVAGPPPVSAPPSGLVQLDGPSLLFKTSPTLPTGTAMAVLEGNPAAPGMFTIRLRVPAGFHLRTHTHPVDERVTVLSGSVAVALGIGQLRSAARVFDAGDFYVTPPGVMHSVWSDDGAVIQITGQGPWQVLFDDGPPRVPG